MTKPQFLTTNIGFAAYLIHQGHKPTDIKVENRNRSRFRFDLSPEDAALLDLDWRRSELCRFFDAFRYLRERTIKGLGEGE